jgi:hypothetical protein
MIHSGTTAVGSIQVFVNKKLILLAEFCLECRRRIKRVEAHIARNESGVHLSFGYYSLLRDVPGSTEQIRLVGDGMGVSTVIENYLCAPSK